MYEALETHLATAGVTLADVVELTTFHAEPCSSKNFQQEFELFGPIHHECFPDHHPRGAPSAPPHCCSPAHRSRCERSR